MATRSNRKKQGLPQEQDYKSRSDKQDDNLDEDLPASPHANNHPSHTSNSNLPSSSTIAKAVAIDTLSNESHILESPIVKQVISIIAGYGLVLGVFKSFKAFRKSFRELRQALKTKNPPETYKARVMEKVWKCVRDIASFTGYAASIISLVAAVSNPFGLAIAGATLTIITAVGLGAAFVSILAEKLAEKKIASTREFLNEIKEAVDQSDFKDHPHAKRFRKIHDKLLRIHDKARGISQEYRKHGHKNPALFLINKAHEHEGLCLKAAHDIGGDHYEHIAASTLKTLASLKNDPNPMYHGIKVARKMMANDPQGLLIKIPKIQEAALRATDAALEHLSTPKPSDHIRRFKDHHGNVQIRMNADPSDEALCLMMAAVAQGLGPLKMKPGGDVTRVLRVLEAAKLADVKLSIDPKDHALFEEAAPEMQAYFHALLQVSATQFQNYVEKEVKKQGVRVLGEIPEHIPSNWKSSPQYTKK